ncbi:coatomer protein [Neoconidiobolus thromboides FSU 785]|nr:coatomer protein [Neoconidiobolus thromboides FSU 785]
MSHEPVYTILSSMEEGNEPSHNELKKSLEKGRDSEKISSLKSIINLILNGDNCEDLLMHIIRFVMPTKNKVLKKILHFYWEVCPKFDNEGKLKQEMILVCNAIRNDLQHPNEFIRGATLRFLSKLQQVELLEPLIPSCRACLEHRLSYVRKNAINAIHSIYKIHPNLLPDAPELLQSFLIAEPDATCKRNAFIMLSNTAPQLATQFIKQNYEQIISFDELLQLAILEHIRKDAIDNVGEKARYIQTVVELLSATSPSVKYEAATSLPLLSSNTVAIKASGACFLELGLKESDNNVKLIVLDRFESLSKKNFGLFSELAMDLLRIVTSSPDIDVRSKVLMIANSLINKRNVDEIIHFLQKELSRTHDQQYEKNSEYRELLIKSIHTCAIQFPEVASKVINVLIEFLSENNNNAAVDVISFIREVAERFPELRANILPNLLASFLDIKTSRALRGALWVIGEYSTEREVIESAWQKIRESLGEIPIISSEQLKLEKLQDQSSNEPETTQTYQSSSRRVNADGTYATESTFTSNSNNLEALKSAPRPPIRSLLIRGDYFVASVLSSTLTKLVLRMKELSIDSQQLNSYHAEAMLIMTSILRLGQSQFTISPIDNDNYDRVLENLKMLSGFNSYPELQLAYSEDSQKAYKNLLNLQKEKVSENKDQQKKKNKIEVDDKVTFRFFENKNSLNNNNEYELDLTKATGELEAKESYVTKLDRIISLSGFSDAIYCEAVIEVHQFDILLDILMVNMTDETLQNVSLEFATLGDLKLVEKPTSTTLAANQFYNTRASIKVASTETGVIFGNLNYDLPKSSNEGSSSILLNDLHIDIMDYIYSSECNLHQFRSMWTEFEWENKVNLNHTVSDDLKSFLSLICQATNMKPLSNIKDLEEEDCYFLSTNLYAKTIFGEDALANLSVERKENSIQGHIRIRSKAQGLALALGDKVSLAIKSKIKN